MKLPPIILASASPRRSELLRELGLPFTVWVSRAEEVESGDYTPRDIALVNAERKARIASRQFPGSLVLGADTVVALGNVSYAKPVSLDDAARMLRELAGHTHQVITGVCLIHADGPHERLFHDITQVTFRAHDPAVFAEYLRCIQPLDKAGGYALQDHGDMIVERVEGSASHVVGLPLERLRAELERWPRG